MNDGSKTREALAREANRVRTKLLHTVEELDHRRHQAVDLRLQLERHARQLLAMGGILLVATAGLVGLVVHRVSTSPQRRRRERWALARDVWRHPDRALRGERRSFFGTLVRSVLLSVISAALTVPARRAVAALVPGPVDEPREVH